MNQLVRIRLPASALAGLLVMSACRTSTMERPEPPVDPPAEWTGLSVGSPDPGIVPDDWWRTFDSAELDAVVREALENNHDLAAAVSRVEELRAQARIAGADRWPSVSVGSGAGRAKRNFIGFPIPGSDADVLSTTTSSRNASPEISWEVDLWGRLAARQASATAELGASEAELYGIRLSLAGVAASSFIRLIEAGQQVELAERTLDSRERSERRVWSRYRSGLSSSLDLRLARSEEALARSSVEARDRMFDAARRNLEVLLGRYPSADLETPPVLPSSPEAVPSFLPSELVVRRPDLRAAEMRLYAAGARVDQARRSLYPRLTLTGSAGTASQQIGDLLDGDFSVWSIAAGLLQPLFQGGRLRADVDRALSAEEFLLQTYLQQVLESFAEVETALAAESYLKEQEEALALATTELRAAEDLALRRYSDGLGSFLSVLETQRQSFVAESRSLALRRDRLLARINLVLALGGGYTVPDTGVPQGGGEAE